jgi:hypothetical protein
MKNLLIFLAVMTLALLMLPIAGPAQEATSAESTATVKLGTFDSRVLAIAYYRSDDFKQYVADVREQHTAAKKAGDQETVDRLEQMMVDGQVRTHKQGFGAAPIPEILELIKDEIPGIAEEAGVDVLVCKWDVLYQKQDSPSTDLSLRLAEHFNPDKATLKILKEIPTTDPVPLAELESHLD